jgi:hypothetical protein
MAAVDSRLRGNDKKKGSVQNDVLRYNFNKDIVT